MAFFGKLFEKKECSICGGEIGLLGNRKLEDGNLCKNCAAKLSPWFSERRESTVEQIREQLEYREANREKVAAFNVTRTMGQYTKVLLDEDAGVFMVTSARDLEETNPDVLAFSDVTGCELDIDENHRELKQTDKEGKSVSYVPPRFQYDYNFYLRVQVNHPYFSDMKLRLNRNTLEIITQQPQLANRLGMIGRVLRDIEPETSVEYRHYKKMGEDAKAALLGLRQDSREQKAAEAQPVQKICCPYCCAMIVPNGSGQCEFCGGSI